MASLRDVKSKITGVKKTKQITKAMNMVASAKMRNAQARIERFRPYAAKFYEMLKDLASGADASVHPLLEVREEVKTVGIVLVTSDRGLCGSFNTNLIKMAARLAAGKKAADDYTARRYHQQGDEWQPDWTFAGAARDLEVVYTLGEQLANSRAWPNWSAGEPFRATRDASADQRR